MSELDCTTVPSSIRQHIFLLCNYLFIYFPNDSMNGIPFSQTLRCRLWFCGEQVVRKLLPDLHLLPSLVKVEPPLYAPTDEHPRPVDSVSEEKSSAAFSPALKSLKKFLLFCSLRGSRACAMRRIDVFFIISRFE